MKAHDIRPGQNANPSAQDEPSTPSASTTPRGKALPSATPSKSKKRKIDQLVETGGDEEGTPTVAKSKAGKKKTKVEPAATNAGIGESTVEASDDTNEEDNADEDSADQIDGEDAV